MNMVNKCQLQHILEIGYVTQPLHWYICCTFTFELYFVKLGSCIILIPSLPFKINFYFCVGVISPNRLHVQLNTNTIPPHFNTKNQRYLGTKMQSLKLVIFISNSCTGVFTAYWDAAVKGQGPTTNNREDTQTK